MNFFDQGGELLAAALDVADGVGGHESSNCVGMPQFTLERWL